MLYVYTKIPRCYRFQLDCFSPKEFFVTFFEIYSPSSLDFVWFDLVVYQVSTFFYLWNWSKVYCGGGGGWVVVLNATLVFTFGPNLQTRTLLQYQY